MGEYRNFNETELPYSDPPFAAISIKTSVSVNVRFANYIEMTQVKM